MPHSPVLQSTQREAPAPSQTPPRQIQLFTPMVGLFQQNAAWIGIKILKWPWFNIRDTKQTQNPGFFSPSCGLNLIFVSFDCCSLFHGVFNTSEFLSPSPPAQIYEGWAFMDYPLPQNIWEIHIPQTSPASSSKLPTQAGPSTMPSFLISHLFLIWSLSHLKKYYNFLSCKEPSKLWSPKFHFEGINSFWKSLGYWRCRVSISRTNSVEDGVQGSYGKQPLPLII